VLKLDISATNLLLWTRGEIHSNLIVKPNLMIITSPLTSPTSLLALPYSPVSILFTPPPHHSNSFAARPRLIIPFHLLHPCSTSLNHPLPFLHLHWPCSISLWMSCPHLTWWEFQSSISSIWLSFSSLFFLYFCLPIFFWSHTNFISFIVLCPVCSVVSLFLIVVWQ
jgi:hypothetical protein